MTDDREIFNFVSMKFKASDLRLIPEPYLTFALAASVASNDMVVFQRVIISSSLPESSEDIVNNIATSHSYTIQRQFISKVVEFVKIFDDFCTSLSRYPEMRDSIDIDIIKKSLVDMKSTQEYEVAKYIRNKVTNHYVGQELSKIQRHFPDDHEFSSYINEISGNSFHMFAEEISFFGSIMHANDSRINYLSVSNWALASASNLIKMQQQMLSDIFSIFVPNADYSLISAIVEERYITYFDDEKHMPLFAPEKFKL